MVNKSIYKKTPLRIFAPLKLLKLRKERGLTQSQLGDKIGVSKQAISYYENDEKTPSFNAICKLASALGCKVDDLTKLSRKPKRNPVSQP